MLPDRQVKTISEATCEANVKSASTERDDEFD
jgi:hypothetical protein